MTFLCFTSVIFGATPQYGPTSPASSRQPYIIGEIGGRTQSGTLGGENLTGKRLN